MKIHCRYDVPLSWIVVIRPDITFIGTKYGDL